MNVALMITCLGDVLRPEVGKAVVETLRQLGHGVTFPESQTCCGQPLFNSGLAEQARRQAMHTIEAFESDLPVVVPSGSCAAMVKIEFPHLFHDDSKWHDRARQLAARTFEFSDFLVNQLRVCDVGASFQGRIAYHYACHLRLLGQVDAVPKLLQHVRKAEVVPLTRQDQCCGFGGSFSIRYPHISGAMVSDKEQCLVASGAEAVVSTDAGCLMNIGGKLHRGQRPLRVLHIAELLRCRD